MWEFALPFARGSQRKRAGRRAKGLGRRGGWGISASSQSPQPCAPTTSNSICNVGGKEFAEAVSNDVLKLLTANLTKSYVRKKSALTTLRLYRKSADALPAAEWADKILSLLDEKNIGALPADPCRSSLASCPRLALPHGTSASTAGNPRTHARARNKDYSNDYLYYGIPTPWLHVKLLRMLQFFPAPEEHATQMRVTQHNTHRSTDVTKNVNKNNATHAVLFEAISTLPLPSRRPPSPPPSSTSSLRRTHFRGRSRAGLEQRVTPH